LIQEGIIADFLANGLAQVDGWEGCRVTGLVRLAGGESAETWRFRVAREGAERDATLVGRWYGTSSRAAGFSNVDREHAALQAAQDAGVPVPHTVFCGSAVLDRNPRMLLVTTFVDGPAPSPWKFADRTAVAELRRSESFRRSFVETLVQIHETPVPEALRRADAENGTTMVDRELERCVADTSRAGFAHDPVVTYAVEWLRHWSAGHRLPDTDLTHGDYRLGNLIVGAEHVSAVLDWEGAQGGCGLYDLAWLLAPVGMVDGLSSGIMHPAELAASYMDARSTVEPAVIQGLAVLAVLRNVGTWLGLAGLGAQNAADVDVRLRRLMSALKVRVDLLHPIFGGPEFFTREPRRAAEPTGLAELARGVRRFQAERGDVDPGSARRLSAMSALVGGLARQAEALPAFALAGATAAFLSERGHPVDDASPGLDGALAEHVRAQASGNDGSLFGPCGPADPALAALLRSWSSIEAGWLLGRPRALARL
jgi:aminoglycoside phosphotransferase (APT) family kinase protein